MERKTQHVMQEIGQVGGWEKEDVLITQNEKWCFT